MGEMVRAAVLGPARDPVALGILLQRALGRQQLPVIGAATVRNPAPEPAGVAGQLGGARPVSTSRSQQISWGSASVST